MLRALEHLGFAEPNRRQPVEIEELEEPASSLTLPRLSAASLPALVLRRPMEVAAICVGSASATAPAGDTAIEAGGLPAAFTTEEGFEEADPKPPTMAEHWAAVERQLEEAHAARCHARVLEDAALASWDRFIDEYHCGREIARVWASRVQSLQEE